MSASLLWVVIARLRGGIVDVHANIAIARAKLMPIFAPPMTLRTARRQPASPFKSLDRAMGATFKSLRARSQKTQEEVAIVLGVSKQQYQKCESGSSKWTLERIYRLADYFNREVREILPPTVAEQQGMAEDGAPFAGRDLSDADAAAISKIVETFSRLRSRTTRRKIIDLLEEMA